MIDTKRLRELAEKATNGPWRHNKDFGQIGEVATANNGTLAVVQELAQLDHKRRDMDAEFIAAANPQTILSLLDRIDDLEALQQPLADTCEQLRQDVGDRDALLDSRDAQIEQDEALMRRMLKTMEFIEGCNGVAVLDPIDRQELLGALRKRLPKDGDSKHG